MDIDLSNFQSIVEKIKCGYIYSALSWELQALLKGTFKHLLTKIKIKRDI